METTSGLSLEVTESDVRWADLGRSLAARGEDGPAAFDWDNEFAMMDDCVTGCFDGCADDCDGGGCGC